MELQYEYNHDCIDTGRMTLYRGDSAIDILDSLIDGPNTSEITDVPEGVVFAFKSVDEDWTDIIVKEGSWSLKTLREIQDFFNNKEEER